jgi:hypothetical protein
MKDIFLSIAKKIYTDIDYSIYTILKNDLLIKISTNITTPEFQREINNNKVASIFKESNDNQKWFNTHGYIIIGRIENTSDFNYYLLDGIVINTQSVKECVESLLNNDSIWRKF